jgi:geranylgeranyl pyrophosphate synthase
MQIKLRETLEAEIQTIEDRMRKQFSGNPIYIESMLEQLITVSRTRIRPSLVILMGRLFDAPREALLDLAAAIEMMHTATMVHDELIDGASRSRGKQTVQRRFTTSSTILAGDLAFAAAAQLAAAVQSIPVMQQFSKTLQTIVNGEITYLFNDVDRRNQEAYYNWIQAKTASVFELAASMAATIGLANPAQIAAAAEFGCNLGMAHQIREDILDLVNGSNQTGKPIEDDLRRGVLTLPTLLYLEAHPDEINMDVVVGGNGNGRAYIEDLIETIRQSDAIVNARQKADWFLQNGIDALIRLPDTPIRAEVAELSHDLIKRMN